MPTHRRLVWMVLALAAGACAESRTPPDPMGNTNWLRPCDRDAECGPGLQCSCGVCTRECDGRAECGELPDAVCDSSSDAFELACGRAEVGVCLPRCAQPDDCAADQRCVDSRCLPEPIAVRGDDAGPCAAASCPEDAGADARAMDAQADAEVAPDAMVPDATVPNPPTGCGAGFLCENTFQTSGAIKDMAISLVGELYLADWGTRDELGNHNGDGALLRWPGSGGEPDVVRDGLDRPWRVWPENDELYWLSGDFGAFGVGPGPQTLYHMPLASGAESMPLTTGGFAHVHVDVEAQAAYWLSDGGTRINAGGREGDAWSNQGSVNLEETVELIAGVDDGYVYFEGGNNTGGLRRFREREGLDTLTIASSIFLVTVGSDALWFIHTDSQQRDWVSFAPKFGGPPTHVADAAGYFDKPQPGTSVVWFVTGEQGTESWQLWSAPRTGGARAPAFRFPTERGLIREDAPPPVWVAEGDVAWVFARGTVHRIQRE